MDFRFLPRARAGLAAALLAAMALLALASARADGGAAAEAAVAAAVAEPAAPVAARRTELLRMLRQDCGACHGLHLTGGLGPALTRQALADKPVDSMAATIFHGRRGTPMPPWRAMLNEAEALWLAEQLLAGVPAEAAKVSAR